MKEYIKNNALFCVLVVLFFLNLLIFYNVFWESRGNTLKVYFFDVGQGDATLIQSPYGGRVLIDGGPGKKIISELSRVLPFYDKKIDVVLETHPDQDHIGGLPDVFEKYFVSNFISPEVECLTSICSALDEKILKNGTQKILARKDLVIDLGGGIFLKILFPDRDVSKMDTNDASIISKLSYGNSSFIFTGDSPQKIEDYVGSIFGENLKSDVLKVGHHGSRTSTSANFLAKVDPLIAIISAGKNNSYNHPHKEVLDLLKNFGAEIFETLGGGMVSCFAEPQREIFCQ